MTIKELMKESHKTAVEKGFWEIDCPLCKGKGEHQNPAITHISHIITCYGCHGTGKSKSSRNDGELIALMHSELSETLEALRHGNPKSEHLPEFTSVEEEIADLMIRVGDFCEARHIRLEEAIIAKMEFNKSREYKHGKKF